MHTYQHKNFHFQFVKYIKVTDEMTQGSSSAAYTVTKFKYTQWYIFHTGLPIHYQYL